MRLYSVMLNNCYHHRGLGSLKYFFCSLIMVVCSLAQAQTPYDFIGQFEQSGPVNDFAGLLSAEQESRLSLQIDSLEQQTGIEYAICLIETLDGYDIKTLAVHLGNQWGVGKADADNGVLFLIAKKEGRIFIATGTGTEQYLPNAQVKSVIDHDIIPYLITGNYFEGISHGITSIQAKLSGTALAETETNGTWNIIIIILVVGALIYVVYDFRKLGGFDPETRKLGRNRGLLGGDTSSGGGGSSGGGSFGGGGAGGSFGGDGGSSD